jgi:hypothetical protein
MTGKQHIPVSLCCSLVSRPDTSLWLELRVGLRKKEDVKAVAGN